MYVQIFITHTYNSKYGEMCNHALLKIIQFNYLSVILIYNYLINRNVFSLFSLTCIYMHAHINTNIYVHAHTQTKFENLKVTF